ncbi:unnamed protein product [Ostreobium quekettii]|uniref:FAS1 domain-containing protein n=1 Tax=Ostreobium quekettii TaxID=121088 RepID=A0A8S1JCQ9_9CHLO|nr:unnamed protein product [Ostreobium quekettii]
MSKVLQLHVVPDTAASSDDLTDGLELDTLLGGKQHLKFRRSKKDAVKIDAPGGEKSKPALLLKPDVAACKTVVHVIDTVLVPDT